MRLGYAVFNPLSANPTKWPNKLKQFVGKLPANCLSVFDHFLKLALKGLRNLLVFTIYPMFRYNEVCEYEYDFNSNDMNGQVLHFTQVVWKKSSKLGMGYAKGNKDGMTCYYAVGRYREAGNMMGDFKMNVPKGLN